MGDIQRAHIHGYPADDRRATAANQGFAPIGQNKGISVAVTHRDSRYPCSVSGDVGPVVSDAISPGEFFDENNGGLKGHHRFENSLALCFT